MSEERLRELLEESASRHDVGPVPVDLARRRRSRLPLLAAAAVLVVTGGVVVSQLGDSGAGPVASDPPTGTSLPLATAEEPATGGAMEAGLSGRLTSDETGCLAVGGPTVWPFGFRAEERAGRAVLLDETGAVVAEEGDYLESGGGSVPVGPRTGSPCAPEQGDVFLVQSEITVATPTSGTPAPLPTSDWEPGDPADLALITGTLVIEGDCLELGEGYGIVWPKGFTAVRTTFDRFAVFDAEGDLVALDGETLRAGGGYSTPEPSTGLAPCIDKAQEVAYIQSEVPLTG